MPVYLFSKKNLLKMRKSVKNGEMNNGECIIIIKVIIRNDNYNNKNDTNTHFYRLYLWHILLRL